MAVSMDRVAPGGPGEAPPLPLQHTPLQLHLGPLGPAAVPPEAALAMPAQQLGRWSDSHADFPRAPVPGPTRMARLVAFGGGALLTAFGVAEMIRVVGVGEVTPLQWALVALFAVTFGWIALAATTAIAGLGHAPVRPEPDLPSSRHDQPQQAGAGRTALVMPVYNEDPASVFAGLAAMAEELAALPEMRQADRETGTPYEIFVLSDTRDPDLWIAEEQAFMALRRRCPWIPVWYRRRTRNTARKAGNVEEFVKRWGGRYAHMLVLDADSLMTGEAVTALRAAMIADPRAGIVQTSPRLIGGTTLLGRLQQFATRIYGPVVSDGIAAWQGHDGNYWGHNAIIRTAAFAQAAGLPVLPGRKPFGGAIMSHDFVEAALIRRAGWSVTMLPAIAGSYEGAPPSLLDIAIRDRRWSQGNLQHAGVIAAHGLRWPNRVHFATGILSYLMSPIWLTLLLTGLALAVQARFIRPDYFAGDHSLFPTWPQFDAEGMIRLFLFAMAVLLLPKLIGIARALLHGPTRRGCGGAAALLGSAVAEILLSSLMAPIMMLVQTRFVIQILAGQDSGWGPQRRDDGGWPLRQLLATHRGHVLAGLALTAIALSIVPALAAWMAPALAGLILAVPISAASGSTRLGRLADRLRLLRIPEETAPPQVLSRARALRRDFALAGIEGGASNGLTAVLSDPDLLALHLAALSPEPRTRGRPDPVTATAEVKLREAADLAELDSWLEPPERLAILGDPRLLLQAQALGSRLGRIAAG